MVPPLPSHIERFNVQHVFDGLTYLENENPIRYLDILDGLFDVDQHMVPVVLVNKHIFEIVVGKGKLIGKIEQLDKSNILIVATSDFSITVSQSKLIKIDKNLSNEQSHRL